MITEQYKNLIRRLIDTTNKGLLKWGTTSLQGRYEAEIAEYKVTINLVKDDGAFQIMLPDTEWATLRFVDETGSVFDKISLYEGKSADYKLLQELYDVARRSANHIDEKIDGIVQGLNRISGMVPD